MPKLHVLATACVLLTALPCHSRADGDRVLLGVDRVQQPASDALAGLRVGLITNHTGLDSRGRSTIDVLAESDRVKLVRLFSPEHGLRGELDQSVIVDSVDTKTGLPVVSLYGKRRQPSAEHLQGLDALVFDIQDIGCRFYTYIATMKLAMQASANSGIRFVVLDRPNPLGGNLVAGPMRDPGADSFVACHNLPVVHGMTTGELARLFAADLNLDLRLEVVEIKNWRRSQTWDHTGLVWTNPSPNMRRLSAAFLYPGVGLLETTNLSVGRGTDTPFEVLGAPWIEPTEFAAALNQAGMPGVRAVPRRFTPDSGPHAGNPCGGVDLIITDLSAVKPIAIGLTLAHTLRNQHPEEWETERLPRLLVNKQVEQAIVRGHSPQQMAPLVEAGIEEFLRRRANALLYR